VGTDQTVVRGVINALLQRADKGRDDLTHATSVCVEALELDSLEAAELSAMLEDASGSDPFSVGDQMPEIVGEILDLYEVAASA
jgi:acyl carrier protein